MSSSSPVTQAEQKFLLLLASYIKELNLLSQELEKGEFLKSGGVKEAKSAVKQVEKSPFLIRGLSVPNVYAQAFLGLAPPTEIKIFTPPITKANQPQTFNMPNGTVLWLIVDNNLPTQLDQISISFDSGQSYKTIPKGSTFNLSPFSIPFWPEALEVVPCLIEKEELSKNESGRVNRNKEYNLERAQRKIAESIAKTYQKYTRYSLEYKQDALDDLADQIQILKPIYQDFKCAKGKKKEEVDRLGAR